MQLLQAQVLELNGRLGALELSHAAGQEAISSFAEARRLMHLKTSSPDMQAINSQASQA